MKITNHDYEAISYKTYEKLSFGETIRLVSSDSKIFKVPKILLSFLCRYCGDDYDAILTPVGSKNLAQIVEIVDGINLTGESHDFTEEIQKDAEILGIESIVRAKALIRTKREKSKELAGKSLITFIPNLNLDKNEVAQYEEEKEEQERKCVGNNYSQDIETLMEEYSIESLDFNNKVVYAVVSCIPS